MAVLCKEDYKTLSQSLLQRIEEKLQMSNILCSVWKEKEGCSAQKAIMLAPTVIELFSRLKRDGINPAHKEQNLKNSDIKHVDKISNILPEIIKRWSKIRKRKGLSYKIQPKTQSEKLSVTSDFNLLHNNLKDIEYVECGSLREEALVTLLRTKEILQDPIKKVSIISNNPQLIKVVLSLSKLWKIEIDNYFGFSCRELMQIDFMRLIIETIMQKFAPIYLIALLRHKLFCFNKQDFDIEALVAILEKRYLRGIRKYNDLAELIEAVSESKLRVFLWLLKEEFNNLSSLILQPSVSLYDILQCLIHLVLRLSGNVNNEIYLELKKIKFKSENIEPQLFPRIFDLLFANEKYDVCKKEARVKIFSLDDDRVSQSDYIILTGMNEETLSESKPYDIRLIQNIYNLLDETKYFNDFIKIEHVFLSLIKKGNLLLTRSSLINGTPQTPSRFLIKLKLIIHKANLTKFYNTNLLQEARMLYRPSEIIQQPLAAPSPNFNDRLKSLSVTQVEKLIKDPYSIYVSSILRLRKLEELDRSLNKVEFGKFIHKVIDRFSKNYLLGKDKEAYFDEVMSCGQIEAAHIMSFPLVKTIWFVQLKKLANWIVNFEASRRKKGVRVYSEETGKAELTLTNGNKFILSCKADRLEVTPNGIKIIDFKTGSIPSKKNVFTGLSPQLPLEALIMLEKGFSNILSLKKTKINIDEIAYVAIGTGVNFGNIISFKENLTSLINDSFVNLKGLIEFYNNATTPFLICPDLDYGNSYNEYAHIERVC
ncbi:MAG: PD-(D/E)XK nuclease family protein [Rickettsiales bacterium]|nr:PD-(D/E)XK nuclease family protein [Rickettsiales bacterium]